MNNYFTRPLLRCPAACCPLLAQRREGWQKRLALWYLVGGIRTTLCFALLQLILLRPLLACPFRVMVAAGSKAMSYKRSNLMQNH